MFTGVKNKEKIVRAKTASATSTTGGSNAFTMYHIRKSFINAASVFKI